MKTKQILQVFRTIHPVGQGAFYSETLHIPGSNDDKHIVYDCGTSSTQGVLENEIAGLLPDNSTIDVLFISHFHKDHINGIEKLAKRFEIKNVVLPQIDGYEWFFIADNYLHSDNGGNMPDTEILSKLKKHLTGSKLIQVSPRSDQDGRPVFDEQHTSFHDAGSIIDGSSPLFLDEKEYKLWHYVPVNPLSKKDLDALRSKIESLTYNGEKIEVKDLQDRPEVLFSLRSQIKKIYEETFGGSNEYSMCLLSEATDHKKYDFHSFSSIINKVHWSDFHPYHPLHNLRNDAALYTGDADFVNTDVLECLENRFQPRKPAIILLQLPHHGSIENFKIDLLNWVDARFFSFACYGSKNSYHHPSRVVMGTAGTYGIAVGIDEKSSGLSVRTDVYDRPLLPNTWYNALIASNGYSKSNVLSAITLSDGRSKVYNVRIQEEFNSQPTSIRLLSSGSKRRESSFYHTGIFK